jgi:GTP-binding protein EngB required for normal cell division
MLLDKYIIAIQALKDIAEHIENEELLSLIKQQAEKIGNTEFHIVIIGQFKRGKSTLINYFLGDDILPTGVIPITSIITHIRYSNKPRTVVTFKNSKTLEVNLGKIDQYISEQHNPQNVKQVEKIDIYYPAVILKNGLVLIDTPGIGSIHRHNTKEAYRYLPQADAAIFLISSDAPISELELDFLSEIKRYFQKVFFVQNKIDYLSEDEKKESLLFSANAISKHLGKEINIYPVSARLALEGKKEKNTTAFKNSSMALFEDVLEKFLLKEKGDYLLKSYEEKLDYIIQATKEQIDFQISILNSPIEVLEQQLEEFKSKAAEVARLKKEALVLVEMDLKAVIDLVENDIVGFRTRNGKIVKEGLTNLYYQNQNMKFKELSSFLNAKLELFIEDAYSEWDREQKIKLKEDYGIIIKNFTNRLNEAIDFINGVTYEVFRLKIAQPLDEMAFVDKDRFFFKFGSSSPAFLLPKIKDFLFLLPKKIRDKIMLSDLIDRVDEELEKNGNNLKWDYSCKLKDSKFIFERVYQEKVDQIIENVEEILKKTLELRNKERASVEARVSLFKQLDSRLHEIKGTWIRLYEVTGGK